MEVEVKPISLDDRLGYIKKIAENQQVNKSKFPWAEVCISVFIGGLIMYCINEYQKRNPKGMDSNNVTKSNNLHNNMGNEPSADINEQIYSSGNVIEGSYS